MRVFKCTKNLGINSGDLFKIELKDVKGFNGILISNPKYSNNICIMNSINLKEFKDVNNISIIYFEDSTHSKIQQYCGDIGYKIVNESSYKEIKNKYESLLELDNINTEEKINDLIENYSLIMLPGSNIIIKFDNELKNINLKLRMEFNNIK